MTHQERMEMDEDLQVKQILRGRSGKRKRGISGIIDVVNGDSDSESEDKGLSGSDTGFDECRSMPPIPSARAEKIDKPQNIDGRPLITTPVTVGSALRRNEDGTVIVPTVKIRSERVTFHETRLSQF